MNKTELKQIYYLNREVRMWQRELERLECNSLARKRKPGSGEQDIKKIVEGKLKEIEVRRAKIMEYINGIDDSYVRQIVYYRNVALMSWEQIADELGGSGESHRKAYERFVK